MEKRRGKSQHGGQSCDNSQPHGRELLRISKKTQSTRGRILRRRNSETFPGQSSEGQANPLGPMLASRDYTRSEVLTVTLSPEDGQGTRSLACSTGLACKGGDQTMSSPRGGLHPLLVAVVLFPHGHS